MIGRSKLRDMLNEWNPIGVIDLPEDEYGCLADKILEWLVEGIGSEVMVSLIEENLDTHFEIESDNVEEFVEELFNEIEAISQKIDEIVIPETD